MPVDIILTSKPIQSGNLIRNRELILLINGVMYDEFLSNNVRTSCLNDAIRDFDHMLETTAERFRDHKLGLYLWLYTPDFIRSEDILYLFRRFYLKSIIQYIHDHFGIRNFKSEIFVFKEEKKLYRQLSQSFSIHYQHLIRNQVLNFIIRYKAISKIFSMNVSCLFSRSNKSFSGTLIDTSTRFTKNRYDNLSEIERIFQHNIRYFSGEQLFVRGVKQEKTVVFKKEINPDILFSSLWKSLCIQRFLKKYKEQIPPALYENHRGFYKMLLHWDLIMSQKCIDKYLSGSKIKNIIQVSTLTKPLYRSLITSARKFGIPFIQVASRTLMASRCSDRILKCDTGEYPLSTMPDYFIVKDQYSKKVFESYPSLAKKVYVGGRYQLQKVIRLPGERPFSMCILLNHRKDLSDKLLDLVLQTKIYKKFEMIFFRCHPSYKIHLDEVSRLFPDNKVIDLTGINYDKILDYRTIVLSGATTASLEVVQYGAVILWIPFIWNDSVLFDDLMDVLGLKCESPEDLKLILESLVCNVEDYDKQYLKDSDFCNIHFRPQKLISEQIAMIIHSN